MQEERGEQALPRRVMEWPVAIPLLVQLQHMGDLGVKGTRGQAPTPPEEMVALSEIKEPERESRLELVGMALCLAGVLVAALITWLGVTLYMVAQEEGAEELHPFLGSLELPVACRSLAVQVAWVERDGLLTVVQEYSPGEVGVAAGTYQVMCPTPAETAARAKSASLFSEPKVEWPKRITTLLQPI